MRLRTLRSKTCITQLTCAGMRYNSLVVVKLTLETVMNVYAVAWGTYNDCEISTGIVYANSERECRTKIYNLKIKGFEEIIGMIQVSEGLLGCLGWKFCFDEDNKEALMVYENTGEVFNVQILDEKPIIPKELTRTRHQYKNINQTYTENKKVIHQSLGYLYGLEQQHTDFLNQGIMDVDEFNEIWNTGGPDILEE